MKTGSEFQRILEIELNKHRTEEKPASSFKEQPAKQDFVFGDDFFQVKFFKTAARKSYKTELKVEIKPENKVAPAPIPKPKVELKQEPVPRVPRKLSFDQIQALKIFSGFGESKIDACSTLIEIKSAYRNLAKRLHPDLNKSSKDEFKILAAAYKKLIQGF